MSGSSVTTHKRNSMSKVQATSFYLMDPKYLQNGKCYSEGRTQVSKYNSIRRKMRKNA
jgi:hypothetical protein